MIILHAGEHNSRLLLWGELAGMDPADKYTGKTRAASHKHPYSTKAQEIDDMLSAGIDIPIFPKFFSSRIWLPTSKGMPLQSDGIDSGRHGSNPKISLSRWTVETLDLLPNGITRVLQEVTRNRSSIAGMAVGSDLAYWSDVLRFACLMVAHQQFLPDLTMDSVSEAKWKPAFLGRYHDSLIELAKRMPASARAFEVLPSKTPGGNSSVATLIRIMNYLVDLVIRSATLSAASPRYVRKKSIYNMYDAWLYGLRVVEDMSRMPRGASEFADDVKAWGQRMAGLAHPSFRMCFRLEEPGDYSTEESGSRWPVRYLLQSASDPDLVIPAEKIWSGDGVQELGSDAKYAKEFLIGSLGRMSAAVSGMDKGLKEHGMAGYSIDDAAAYRFLTEEAPMLEQLGCTVMLPEWWTGATTSARLAARAVAAPEMQADGMLDLNSIVEFDWQLALGDQTVTLEELMRLADAKLPLVRICGQWVETRSGKIGKAIDFMKKNGIMTLRDSIMMEFGSSEAPEWMDLSTSSSDDRIAGMMDALRGDAKIEDLPQPDGFAGTLRPYQLRGYSWLSFLQGIGLGGCLADDMGLGKTIQMLALIQQYRSAGRKEPILLVCPTSVMDNWDREAARFVPGLSVMIHHGTGRNRDEEFSKSVAECDMVVSSYGLVYRDIASIKKVQWGGVILDEAQNIKNPDTKQSRAVRSLDAGFRFALTGTPVENNVGDLWPIMEFLNPGLLGIRAEFRRNFFLPIQKKRDARASETLRRIIAPFILRRLKTDKSVITDLPEKMEMNVYCSLTREQASLYAAVLKDLQEKLYSAEGIERKGLILATLTKLKQVCNHPAHLLKDGSATADRSGKLARLTEMLEEVISSGDRALIFTQFVEMGEILRRHIREVLGIEVPFLHGGVSRKQRDAMIERFQAGGSDIFIASLKAGGTGLNLTAANHVFHFDRWWNPAVENQATDRAFRIGQRRNVQVHKMICAGTMEERIDDIINNKKEISEVVGTGEGWLANMSNTEIREVLSLSREAITL